MTNWLSLDEQRIWRQWLTLSSRFPQALGQQLQADSGLSLPDFEVLVVVSEAEGGSLRVAALSDKLGWERSRLSHQLTRMIARDLIDRRACPDDGRGALVSLTEHGRRTVEGAAPGHVEAVRRLLFDVLDEDELAALDRITTKVLDVLPSR